MIQPSKNLCDPPLALLQHFTSLFYWGPGARYPAADVGEPGRISILLGILPSSASSLMILPFNFFFPFHIHSPCSLPLRPASSGSAPRLLSPRSSALPGLPGRCFPSGPAGPRPFPAGGGRCPAPAGRSVCGNNAGSGEQGGEQGGSSRPGFRARWRRDAGGSRGRGAERSGEERREPHTAGPATAQGTPGVSLYPLCPPSTSPLSAVPLSRWEPGSPPQRMLSQQGCAPHFSKRCVI